MDAVYYACAAEHHYSLRLLVPKKQLQQRVSLQQYYERLNAPSARQLAEIVKRPTALELAERCSNRPSLKDYVKTLEARKTAEEAQPLVRCVIQCMRSRPLLRRALGR